MPFLKDNKVLLLILDGFGEGKDYPGNAILRANAPNLSALRKNQWGLLKAAGQAVGIPEGTQGGSEVGHFTIGAGRVVFQSMEEIKRSIQNGSFYSKPELIEACEHANKNKSALHLLGMLSDQGVHSDIRHLFALLKLAKDLHVERIFIHGITDGRDVPERSAKKFIKQIQKNIIDLGLEKVAKIASLVGRYYAMDRDSNWEKRLKPAYDLLTLGKGIKETDPISAVDNAYERGIETDYYIDPTILVEDGIIKNEDAVIFWNFRTDRARELTWCFTGEMNPKTDEKIGFIPEKIVRPFFVCMGPFSEIAPVVFPTTPVKNNLGQVISSHGFSQLRIAETQKYAHVTYFLNSQVEAPLPNEDRVMVNSPKAHSYSETPAMNSVGITNKLLEKIETEKYDFIAVNFANLDLVGHSGDLGATIKAVETIDECLGHILPVALKHHYVTIITGDHGNAEFKIYDDGSPCPSHTTNPVPIFVVSKDSDLKIRKTGELKDIAPTILKIMGIEKPPEMTGTSLI